MRGTAGRFSAGPHIQGVDFSEKMIESRRKNFRMLHSRFVARCHGIADEGGIFRCGDLCFRIAKFQSLSQSFDEMFRVLKRGVYGDS